MARRETFEAVDGDSEAEPELVVVFDLEGYRFEHYRAYVDMTAEARRGGRSVLRESYSVEGSHQGSAIWGFGASGATDAILVSTKDAIDQIVLRLQHGLAEARVAGAHRDPPP